MRISIPEAFWLLVRLSASRNLSGRRGRGPVDAAQMAAEGLCGKPCDAPSARLWASQVWSRERTMRLRTWALAPLHDVGLGIEDGGCHWVGLVEAAPLEPVKVAP